MDIGLIGLPRSGKTTVFNLLTGSSEQVNAYGAGKVETRKALANIPDDRLGKLSEIYHPKKVTTAQVEIVDVPGLSREETGGVNKFFQDIHQVDALIHVIRGFEDVTGEAPHPLKDLEDMEMELGLADLDLLEKRRDRLHSGKKMTEENRQELGLVERLIAALENNQRLTQIDLSEEEQRLIRGYQFLTLKPIIWVINTSDDALAAGDYPDASALQERSRETDVPVVVMAAALEQEMEALLEEDRQAFMADLGIKESGTQRVAQAIYQRLGLISFLTAGEDEVRAWPIPRGISAKGAAGKIHSDIERGFIRAEVIAYEDLLAAGTMAHAKEQGLMRLEGKEYVVQDGDVINFRFNV
ncbi:MAG: redox-regulated ATPase YchF [Firmicutes bacterium]|nr:redox-regulated ATPase YchF [Bacillota bacterium]